MLLVIACALIQVSLAQVTCPGLGDFNPDPPFDGWPDPTCPGNPGLVLVYTMFNTDDPVGREFDRNEVPANFNPAYPTIFLIHGWGGDGDNEWMDGTKNEILANDAVNVIIVGWGGPEGAEDLNYFRSASDTRTVGAETAEIMINLITAGGGAANLFHIAGHSLGAQVTGHAGRWAAGQAYKPAMCTGLDPAGPFFINNTDRSVGIWNDCGDFVQIIHTDDNLGSTPQIGATDVYLGHQDFFVNGGLDQPGCASNGCDHSRAHQVFEESIAQNCHDATDVCTNSADPTSCSPCGLSCPRMGYHAAAGATGRFQIPTTGLAPYCPP